MVKYFSVKNKKGKEEKQKIFYAIRFVTSYSSGFLQTRC